MKKILIFVEEMYEDLELWYPRVRFVEAGCAVTVAGPVAGIVYTGKHGYPCKSDAAIPDMKSKDFDGLVIPGGFAPDHLRRSNHVLDLTREFHEQKKLVAFICHGGWVPVSAKILSGRRVTGTTGIRDDLENAGAVWKNESVVVDGNLVSSRAPADLPDFSREMLKFLGV